MLIDVNMAGCGVKEKEAGDVSRFLNRILGLSVEKQNLVICALTYVTVNRLAECHE